MAIIIVNYVFWYANNSISWMLYTNGIIWDYMGLYGYILW